MSPVYAAGHVSVNLLSNNGSDGYEDGRKVERGDGREVVPTYSNDDTYSYGTVIFGDYEYIGFSMVNFQLQAVGGLHWDRRIALGYFPVLTLTGQHLLHGLQLDIRLPAALGVASAQVYQENLPSILPNPAFGEAGPVLQHRVAGVSLNIPWTFGKYRAWLVPNYRRSLDLRHYRYGANLAFSADLSRRVK
jgi:hypothetical protein